VTQYHHSSFAYATAAVADDLERIAETLRDALQWTMSYPAEAAIRAAFERLDLQVAALREIARREYAQDWVHHQEVPSVEEMNRIAAAINRAGDPKSCGGYDVDPDLEGPSWDDAPDEPRRRS